jgi:hypothetical protein
MAPLVRVIAPVAEGIEAAIVQLARVVQWKALIHVPVAMKVRVVSVRLLRLEEELLVVLIQ